MTETQDKTGANLPADSVDSIEATGSAFRRTARRISQRTTDLIAIAIVSIGVLSVSGRLTEWWNTDPASVASPAVSSSQAAGPALQWGNGESAVSLLAGEYPVQMERRILSGDQDRVDDILRSRLIEILESTPFKDTDSDPVENENTQPDSNQAASEYRAHETQLLKKLQNLPPIERRNGEWNLYRLDRSDNPVPGTFLIATRISGMDNQKESLAAWAMAMPRNARQWTSFVMTPTGAGGASSRTSVPVPADARLVLSLKSDSNDELAVFQRLDARQSDISRWIDEISDQLSRAGWQQSRPWQQLKSSATARFEHTRDGQRQQRRAIEFAVSIDGLNKLTGTANVIVIPEIELVRPGVTQNSSTQDGQQDL